MADAFPARGAHFFKDGSTVMFKFVADSNNVIGPMEATGAHKERYPVEWEAFNNGDPRPVSDDEAKMSALEHKKPAKKRSKA